MRPGTLKTRQSFLSGDDRIPRSTRNFTDICKVEDLPSRLPDCQVPIRHSAAFTERVEDARRMKALGLSDAEIREKHGMFVLKESKLYG